MAKPRINSGDFDGLQDHGMSPQALEALRSAITLGAVAERRADLIRLGVPPLDADLVATNADLDSAPAARPGRDGAALSAPSATACAALSSGPGSIPSDSMRPRRNRA